MGFKFSAKYKNKKLHLRFGKRVASTGGKIRILDRNNKKLQVIKIGSQKTRGGIYAFSSRVVDYDYNTIALLNKDFFKNLAKHDNVNVSKKSHKQWAKTLRIFWNVSIDGNFYRLDKNFLWDFPSDKTFSYYATSPEYTPGLDKSGVKNIVLTPLGGVNKLCVDLGNKLESGRYKVDLSGAGLRLAKGNNLNKNEELDKIETVGFRFQKPKSSKINLFRQVDYLIDEAKKPNKKTALKGTFKVKYKAGDDLCDYEYVTKFEFKKNPLRIPAFSKGLKVDFKAKNKNTPFGEAKVAKKGKEYNYYIGKNNKAATLSLHALTKDEFMEGGYSGDFKINLSKNRINFYNSGSNDDLLLMKVVFSNDLI